MSITYSECVSIAFVIQLAKFMRRIVICCYPSGCTIFPTLSHKGTIFGKDLLTIKCVFRFSLQLSFETFIFLRI